MRRYTASNVLIILIGNKCDLEAEREVEFEEARQMCQYIPEILFVMETSAKENTNVEDAFRCLATELKVSPSGLYVLYNIIHISPLLSSQRQHDASSVQAMDDSTVQLGQGKPLKSCSSSCNLT